MDGIKEIAITTLGEEKGREFYSVFLQLNDDTRRFINTPINLSLCLELFGDDSNILSGELIDAHTLCEKFFDKNILNLVDRHERSPLVNNKRYLTERVGKCFDEFCIATVDLVFLVKPGLQFIEHATVALENFAEHYGLIGNFFCSTFLNAEMLTFPNKEYYFQNKIKKQTLAYLGVKFLSCEKLIRLAKGCESMDFRIFYERKCDQVLVVRIMTTLLKSIECLQAADWLMNMKMKNEDYFNAVMKIVASWNQPFLLLVDLSIVNIDNFNVVLNKYKSDILFQLNLAGYEPSRFISAIETLIKNGNCDLIKQIDIDSSITWDERPIKEFFKLKHLEKITFTSWYNKYYSSSHLSHLSSPLNWFSSGLFHQTCHAHFDVFDIKNPSIVIGDVEKVSSKFPSISVCLHFDSYTSRDLEANLLASFLSSNVQFKHLYMAFEEPSNYPNMMQLVKYRNLETLELFLDIHDESEARSAWEEIFANWDVDSQTSLRKIELEICHPSPLTVMYNELSSQSLGITDVRVRLHVTKFQSALKMSIPDFKDGKQFKKIVICYYPAISPSEIASLKLITESLVDMSGRAIDGHIFYPCR